jgi:hypothetical protein
MHVVTERTSLLPTGLSSNERSDTYHSVDFDRQRAPNRSGGHGNERNQGSEFVSYHYDKGQRKRRMKKNRHRTHRHRQRQTHFDEVGDCSSDESNDMKSSIRSKINRESKSTSRKIATELPTPDRFSDETAGVPNSRDVDNLGHYLDQRLGDVVDKIVSILAWLESFVANLPSTIGAIAFAICTTGVVWFKFTEENLPSCEPVHFHSSQCTFPEFPGCFYCDTNNRLYRMALQFHESCSWVGGFLAILFVLKLLLARNVVFDELSSPTTAAPAGLICMTIDIAAAGKGIIGETLVSIASLVHLFLVIWFIYMALAYHILPDPSWFPNTVSIGISAVKIWLYFPQCGHFLLVVCTYRSLQLKCWLEQTYRLRHIFCQISLLLNFFLFPISFIRVALNKKISAPVAWMQMTAPNVALYAVTIMAQPSFKEEHPDVTNYEKIHRQLYMPCMHMLFVLAMIGMLGSVSSLVVRWNDFRMHSFSPAHAAFCAPTLCHANAIQAYRGAINSFSDIPIESPLKIVLYMYWVLVLIAGTIVTMTITILFMLHLPQWTHIDVDEEAEPPAPNETQMSLSNLITSGEAMFQPFISPAVLQANETGALVLSRDEQGQQRLCRTRQVTALGFEPILNALQLQHERDALIDWVGKSPPRRRHRTLSVPSIDFTYGAGLDYGNSDWYSVNNGENRNLGENTATDNSASDSPFNRLPLPSGAVAIANRFRAMTSSPYQAISKRNPPTT